MVNHEKEVEKHKKDFSEEDMWHKLSKFAKKAGREMSINCGTELVIHRKDGRIQSSDSHGNDPYPPKG